MKVDKQFNLDDRTLLLGVPDFDLIPDAISLGEQRFKVIGISPGAKFPNLSLEIEKIVTDLVGKTVTA